MLIELVLGIVRIFFFANLFRYQLKGSLTAGYLTSLDTHSQIFLTKRVPDREPYSRRSVISNSTIVRIYWSLKIHRKILCENLAIRKLITRSSSCLVEQTILKQLNDSWLKVLDFFWFSYSTSSVLLWSCLKLYFNEFFVKPDFWILLAGPYICESFAETLSCLLACFLDNSFSKLVLSFLLSAQRYNY